VAVRRLAGAGRTDVPAAPAAVLAALLDPAVLAALIPGADSVEQSGDGRFSALLSFGVGTLRSRYRIELDLSGRDHAQAILLQGSSRGGLGGGSATGRVALRQPRPGRTSIDWSYEGEVTGAVALAGDTLLRLSARLFVHRFFAALSRFQFPADSTPRRPPRQRVPMT
jgi:2-furoyl-CoA dehydrogenase large subunit